MNLVTANDIIGNEQAVTASLGPLPYFVGGQSGKCPRVA
ncbi:hypothetical protein HNR49_002278 [Halobacterium salinarum]|uniref:Uncharacterized protein n=1 Tax=Halobacterium salinarum TaxID=2242 RepID=A0A841HF60_HALSI|nr:hypothetical protein [Halobacterium salinarum]